MKVPFLPFLTLASATNLQHPLHRIPTAALSQPPIGFGTWNIKDSPANTSDAVALAIRAGYRQIDCAAAYGNEKDVGRGIAAGLKDVGLERGDIWITSKLWNDHHNDVETAFNQTLSNLNTTYLDLYLMHWPVGKSPSSPSYSYDYLSTWHAMQRLLAGGRVRNIGISNFSPAQLDDLIAHSAVKPAVHQMELHPYLPQSSWLQHHHDLGIAVTAYSPLGNMNPTYGSNSSFLLDEQIVKDVAGKRNCTAAQVVLAWGVERGVSVIPKSKHEKYIRENLGAGECVLQAEDGKEMGKLGERAIRFNNPSKGWGIKLFEGLDNA